MNTGGMASMCDDFDDSDAMEVSRAQNTEVEESRARAGEIDKGRLRF